VATAARAELTEVVRILVLGGTAWLSAEVVRAALTRGHDVTCLARGESGRVPDGGRWVRADRTRADAYDDVQGEPWDVVIDVARQPGQVRGAVAALAGRTQHWVFVSSGNVYADHAAPGADETAPLLPALPGEVMESMETYGEAKVAGEQAVVAGLGVGRSLVARVGLIGGPGDVFDRTGYWPLRFARPVRPDRAVLVPDARSLPVQVIDVRDLAAWLVTAGTVGTTGALNVAGPTLSLPDHLAVAGDGAGHTGPVVSATTAWLQAHHVQAWMGPRSLPLWLDDPDWHGFNALDTTRAVQAGLVTRPLAQTLADTLAWELTREPGPRRAGCPSTRNASSLINSAPWSPEGPAPEGYASRSW
jgi:nucleoside-diphosphate-sugar epimerase